MKTTTIRKIEQDVLQRKENNNKIVQRKQDKSRNTTTIPNRKRKTAANVQF